MPPALGLAPSAAPAPRQGGKVFPGGWELALEPPRTAGWGSRVLSAARPPLTHRSPPIPRAGLAADTGCAGTPALQPPLPPPPPGGSRALPYLRPVPGLPGGMQQGVGPRPCGGCSPARGGRQGAGGGTHPMERRGARCPPRCGGCPGAGTASILRILRSVGLATRSGRRMLGGAGAGLMLSPPGQGVPKPPWAAAGPGTGPCGCRHPAAPSLPGAAPGDPQPPAPRRGLLLRGSPGPPPLSPWERSGLGHRAASQEGTATGLAPGSACCHAHSKGRAGNKPRPCSGVWPLPCHGHAAVALSLLSAQAALPTLTTEKNILFSPRKALPFSLGSCELLRESLPTLCGEAVPDRRLWSAQTARAGAACGAGRQSLARAVLVQGVKVWQSLKELASGEQDHPELILPGPAPASCPFPAGALPPSPQLSVSRGHGLGSAQPRAPALSALAAARPGGEQRQALQDSPGRSSVGNVPPPGTRAARVPAPAGSAAPRDGAQPRQHNLPLVLSPTCGRGLPQDPAGSLQPGRAQAAAGGQRCAGQGSRVPPLAEGKRPKRESPSA